MAFREILGQERARKILQKAIKNNRLPPAYLFSGIEGIGKTTTAISLAKTLNCVSQGMDSCEGCIPCQKISTNNHPDIFILKGEGDSIKIDEIRKGQKFLQYKPYEGKRRVWIIADSEKINLQAQNCLLKTLEEPPPNTLLILVSSKPLRLLPTILSRCQKVIFQPLPLGLISQTLKEKWGKAEEASYLLASLSGGSLGQALSLADKEIFSLRKKLISGLFETNDFFSLSEELAQKREQVLKLLDFAKTWFRDLLVFKQEPKIERLINIDFIDDIRKASLLEEKSLIENLRIIEEAQEALLRNANPRLTLEAMFLRLSFLK